MSASPPAWSDPFFLRAVFYLALATAVTIAALGVPSIMRRRAAESWPLAFVFLTLLGTLTVLGTRYSDVAGIEGLPRRFQLLTNREGAKAPRTFEEFLGLPSVMPKAQQVLDVLPGFLQSVEQTLRRIDPLLERTDRLLDQTEPLIADLRKIGPALDEATPLLRTTNLAVADMQPALIELRAATLELQSTLGERTLGTTIKQLLSTLDRLETTLIQADQLLLDLAFLDENWIRHFLQVEGVQAYAKFGAPEIPPASKPSAPPPLSGK